MAPACTLTNRRTALPSVLLPHPLSPTRPTLFTTFNGQRDTIDRAHFVTVPGIEPNVQIIYFQK